MSTQDRIPLTLGPVFVHGRGWVTPKGWRSPEHQAQIARVMAEQAELEAALAAKGGPENPPPQTGLVVDPLNEGNAHRFLGGYQRPD